VRRENGEQNWAKKKKAAGKRWFLRNTFKYPCLFFSLLLENTTWTSWILNKGSEDSFMKCYIDIINISLMLNYELLFIL